jgi:transposase
MVKSNEVARVTRRHHMVLRVLDCKNSYKQVARDFETDPKLVKKWVLAYQADGVEGLKDKPRVGRPKKVTTPICTAAKKRAHNKSGVSVRKLAGKLGLSLMSAWRALKAIKLIAYRPRVNPLLTDSHRDRRVEFAENMHGSPWEYFVFSDESIFRLHGVPNRGQNFVWTTREEKDEVKPLPKVQNAPSVHVWGAISLRGKSQLYVFKENVNQETYQACLRKTLVPAIKKLYSGREHKQVTFQQDGARPHTAASTQAFLDQQTFGYLDKDSWPASSPDLNPIENLWAIMKNEIYKRQPKTRDALIRLLKKVWNGTPLTTLQSLIGSMDRRMGAVIEADGYTTKY